MENKNALPLSKTNYTMMIISIVVIIIGFALMSGGENKDPNVFNAEELYSFRRITLSVIVTLLGFGFMVFAIMYRKKDKEDIAA